VIAMSPEDWRRDSTKVVPTKPQQPASRISMIVSG
jgi:hypothetical protein